MIVLLADSRHVLTGDGDANNGRKYAATVHWSWGVWEGRGFAISDFGIWNWGNVLAELNILAEYLGDRNMIN